MVLRIYSAIFGTETRRLLPGAVLYVKVAPLLSAYAMSGTDVAHTLSMLPAYALATRCPVLTFCMLLPGQSTSEKAGSDRTRTAHSGTALRACYALSGGVCSVPLSSYAFPTRCPVLTYAMLLPGLPPELSARPPRCALLSAICLRACYAMSGTVTGYGVIILRSHYAMSGTDLAYAATRLRAA
eukprot:3852977-Rhodomonas_salina.1